MAALASGARRRYEPAAMSPVELELVRRASAEKLAAAKQRISACGSAIVAFSAGVDSTLVLAIAREVLGDRAVALTAHSPSVPRVEREEARALAARIGVRHLERESHEQEDPGYVANGQDRCYHCKRELYRLCAEVAREHGAAAILDGFNADDRRDHRPGHRAAEEALVHSPLAEAGLSKGEVRAWSAAYGLPTWEKPQMACLASRIPYGTPVTPERLAQVERAEAALRALGLRDVRVRHHGDIGRVEVGERELDVAFAQRAAVAARGEGGGVQDRRARPRALPLRPHERARGDLSPDRRGLAPVKKAASLLRRALVAAAGLLPVVAGALEPRFDHRDSHGPVLELLGAYDSVTASGQTTSTWRPTLRAGWGFDVSGEGSELIAAADVALRSHDDPRRERVLLAASARYRTYFGTEEWKTFFEAGLWAPVRSRIGVGPLVGLGIVHDFSREGGVFLGAEFASRLRGRPGGVVRRPRRLPAPVRPPVTAAPFGAAPADSQENGRHG